MTFKLADIANEAQLVEIAEQLSEALSEGELSGKALDLSPEYVDAAKTLLADLSEQVAPLSSGTVALTEQQVKSFLDFDPEFLDVAKGMLREFIERTEPLRAQ
jgi:predicted O-methyltransferase YrrM